MSEEKIGIKTDCVFYKDNRHCTALNEMEGTFDVKNT